MLKHGGAAMPDIIQRLRTAMETDAENSALLGEAIREISDLRKTRNALEEILILLARTEVPWDDDGVPNEGMPHFRERYVKAMHEATELLGLDLRSTITRTEPRT
jgi:hypothetical protein